MRALVIAVLLAGCGAKSALEVSAPAPAPIDAAVRDAPVPDAPRFSTIPCRWSAGLQVVVERAEGGLHSPRAAVSEALGRAVVGGLLRTDGSTRTWRHVAIASTPRVEGPLGSGTLPGTSDVFAWDTDWIEIVRGGGTCDWIRRDPAGFPRSMGAISGDQCSTRARDATTIGLGLRPDGSFVEERVALLEREPGGESLALLATVTDAGDHAITTVPLADHEGHAAWYDAPSGTLFLVAYEESSIVSSSPHALPGVTRAPLLAPDPLGEGVVVLFLDRSDRWQLRTIAWQRDDRAWIELPLADLAAFDDEIDRDSVALVTNETEAVFALRDGAMLSAPLDGSVARTIEGPRDPGSREHRVVLAPGTSFGGQVWIDADAAVRFRSLTCNR